MPRDEELGLARAVVNDYAAPLRQGTFSKDHGNENGHRFLPRRTETGFASISQRQSIPGTIPTSLIESLASNATHPRNSQPCQRHDEPTTMPSTRPTSFEEPTIKPGTRPNSFEEPNITLGTHPIFPQRPPPTSLPNPVQEDEDVELGRWLVHTFRDILFNIRRDQEAGKNTRPHLTVDLARLNQMRRLKLQAKLIQQVLHMRYHMTEPKGWEDSLEQYINASKEDDFIQTFTQTCVNKGLNDPFVITTENKGHRALLTTLLDTIPEEERKADGLETITNETFAPPVEPVIGNSPHSTGETRLETIQKQNKEAFIKRLVFSLVGGVFLIAPMWLMVLHNTTYTALISTSVFVTTWAVVAAWQLGDPINVLSTTAAYAAVLVVFVGTNTAT